MPEPGAEWAGFQIEQRIGGGAFGQVFSAWDMSVDRRVAIKILPADASPTDAERFLRESRVAAGLDHPRIVPMHRIGDHEGMAYVVMDHFAGGDLGQQIHVAPLTVERTRSVLGQVAGALDRAHRTGLVHRGVEPANILCADGSGDVFLTDFGAPSASLRYSAPEQVRGETATSATDVYGLGCTLFECLTGRVPFPGGTPEQVAADQLDTPAPKVTDLRPDLPDEIDAIVARAMAKNPAERHPSTRHLAEAVALLRVDEPSLPETAALGITAFPTTDATVEVPDLPLTSRSVFDDPPVDVSFVEVGATGTTVVGVEDRVVDGAAFGIYEDEGRRTHLPAIVISLVVVATVIVGLLAWRAVNTDADLAAANPESTTTTAASTDEDPVVPTVEALQRLVPDGIDTCVAPEGEAASADPLLLQCPIDGVPETLTLELFSTSAARDDRFDLLANEAEVSDRDDAECALGRSGRHAYESAAWSGRVACRQLSGRVDFLWTRDDEPVLYHASGGGLFSDYEQSWERMAGRTDAAFPVREEQRMLDALPEALLVDCDRDLPLALTAPGRVAAACRPPEAEPTVISWVLFADDDPMDAWIEERRSTLDENNFDTTDDGCTPQGFGQVATSPATTTDPEPVPGDAGPGDDQPPEPGDAGVAPPVVGPPPDAAFVDYDLDGSSGQILCFINTSGQNALFWTRDGSRIGSIAVSEQADGDSMLELLTWWRDGGHRP